MVGTEHSLLKGGPVVNKGEWGQCMEGWKGPHAAGGSTVGAEGSAHPVRMRNSDYRSRERNSWALRRSSSRSTAPNALCVERRLERRARRSRLSARAAELRQARSLAAERWFLFSFELRSSVDRVDHTDAPSNWRKGRTIVLLTCRNCCSFTA